MNDNDFYELVEIINKLSIHWANIVKAYCHLASPLIKELADWCDKNKELFDEMEKEANKL